MGNKTILQDTRISWKAKGLYYYLSTVNENEKLTIEKLARVSKDGRDSVRSVLNELEEAGYLYLVETRNEKGQFESFNYELKK